MKRKPKNLPPKKNGRACAENSGKTATLGRPFQKGQSGNPGGRPKTAKIFSETVRAFLEEKSGAKTRLLQVLENLVKDDPKVLLHYAFGKPMESLEVTNPDGTGLMEPLALEIAKHLARQR